METEQNSNISKNNVVNETLFNAEFIGYINALSKAILEFYKVSKNININKNLLIDYAKKELINENFFKEDLINGKGNNNEIDMELIKTLNEIFNELDFNNKSQQKNLTNFFEDSKLLFKKLREKRHEIITKSKSQTRSQMSNSSRNSLPKRKSKFEQKDNEDYMPVYTYNNTRSKIVKENLLNNAFKNKSFNIKNKMFDKNDEIKKRRSSRIGDIANTEYFSEINNLLKIKDDSITPTNNIIHISTNEIKRLRLINKKLSSELGRYRAKTVDKKDGFNNQNNNNFNNFEKVNIFIKDKDKIILSLKEEMNKINKNYNAEINKYKTEIIKLKKDNNRLVRMNNSNSDNNKSEVNKNMFSRLSNLMKENKLLKDNLEELKISNLQSEYNSRVTKKKGSPFNIDDVNENMYLINKIKFLEKKYQEKQTENKELNNKLLIIKKRFEQEKTNFSKKNSVLSLNLMNKEKEILNLQKENLNKDNKLESLKNMLNKDAEENQYLKNNQNIEKIKSGYEIKIFNFNNKIKELESNLETIKKLKFDQTNQISKLNQQIKEKDAKLLEQNYELEKIKFNLNEKLEEQQNLNNDLNDELYKIKNDNELLKNKILSGEKKIFQLYENTNLQTIKDKEIDKLKVEIKSLQFENEKLNFNIKQLKENYYDDNKGNLEKQKEEMEGYKQLIQKLQLEREKGDSELGNLKRENEKIKNQMLRLSKTLPEEFNELQKQYKELENKYYLLKNKNPNSITPKKNKNEEKKEDKFNKELTEAKKEIDQLKKKNVQLVAQLEDKEINKGYYENRSEDANKSNYEEEFDLRKMAKGAKEKNRSQDINIDYPGIQTYKEKIRELEFYYNSLETLVKKLLLTIQTNPKNKTYVAELCRIVGFDLETTNKILTNKNKNSILGLFSKQ